MRFNPGEKANDPEFARKLAGLADIYVNDAFGAAHRAHASTAGVAEYLPAYAGMLLAREVETLTDMLANPDAPFVAILGGSKVSDKFGVIDRLLDVCDTLIIGGGMCFTMLVAKARRCGQLTGRAGVGRAGQADARARQQRRAWSCCSRWTSWSPTQSSRTQRPRSSGARRFLQDMMGLDIGPTTVGALQGGDRLGTDDLLERPDGRVRDDALRDGNAKR